MNDLQRHIAGKGKFSPQEWVVPCLWETSLLFWGIRLFWKSGHWYREKRNRIDPVHKQLSRGLLLNTELGFILTTHWLWSQQDCGIECHLYSFFNLVDIYWKLVVPSIILDSRDNKMKTNQRSLISWRALSKFEIVLIFEYLCFSISSIWKG